MKQKLQQEQTEITENSFSAALFPLLPPVQMPFVQIP